MNKILTTEQTIKVIKHLKQRGKKIVLVGGCFDILHPAHIEFLRKSKKLGDILVVLLESDKKIKHIKGSQRPINLQGDRALKLSSLPVVDYVICLPFFKKDSDYEILVKSLEPDIIAVTIGDTILELKRKYAESVGGKVIEVMARKRNYSTSKIVRSGKL